jgi:hypothetical protein
MFRSTRELGAIDGGLMNLYASVEGDMKEEYVYLPLMPTSTGEEQMTEFQGCFCAAPEQHASRIEKVGGLAVKRRWLRCPHESDTTLSG